jgi:hypothetical protein
MRVVIDVERECGIWRQYVTDKKGAITLEPAPAVAFRVVAYRQEPGGIVKEQVLDPGLSSVASQDEDVTVLVR